jgi:hypothetical protein
MATELLVHFIPISIQNIWTLTVLDEKLQATTTDVEEREKYATRYN